MASPDMLRNFSVRQEVDDYINSKVYFTENIWNDIEILSTKRGKLSLFYALYRDNSFTAI